MQAKREEARGAPRVWLLDGYNVLHAALPTGRERDRWWRADERRRLLERVGRFEDASAELWVVFDGAQPAAETTTSRLRVVFAPSADAWLLARLRELPDPARVAVVTRDRRLAARARDRGAQLVAPRAFLARCGPPDPPAP